MSTDAGLATSRAGPAEATSRGRRPSIALIAFALRACFPRKRRWGLLLPCALALLFGLLARSAESGTPAEGFAQVAANGLFGLLLPIACLVIGDAVMGADVRAGTLPFTWLSPVPFRVIAVARWAAGTLVAWVTIVPAFALAAVLAGVPRAAGPAAVATVGRRRCIRGAVRARRLRHPASDGVVARQSCFSARASWPPRSSASPNCRRAGWRSRCSTGSPTSLPTSCATGWPRGWGAAVQLVVVTVVCLALSGWRLGHLRLSGSSD